MKNNNNYILFIVFSISTIYNISIISGTIGWLGWIVLFLFAIRRAEISLLFIGITQVYATPESFHFTLTQLYLIFWTIIRLPYLIIKIKNFNLNYKKNIIVFIVLLTTFFFWQIIAAITKGQYDSIVSILKLFYSIIIIFIEINTIKSSKKLILTFTLIAFSSVIISLLSLIGFDIVSSEVLTKTISRGNLTRRAVGNGDFNFMASIMLISVAGLFSLLFSQIKYKLYKPYKTYLYFFILSLLIAIPSTILTLSRAALLGLILLIPTYSIFGIIINKGIALFFKKYLVPTILISLSALVLFVAIIYLTFPEYIEAVIEHQQKAKDLTGRGAIWSYAINGITSNPIFGFIPKGIIGKDYYAHNVILDIGVNSGIIGIGLYFLIILLPFLYRRQKIEITILYIFSIYSGLTLSQFNLKLFWMFLIAMYIYSDVIYSYEKDIDI